MIQVPEPTFQRVREKIENINFIHISGRVVQVLGLVVEANGPNARIGDLCYIDGEGSSPVAAEVVGFRGERILLMPLGQMQGIRAGCEVRASGGCLEVPVGDKLLGRILNGLGEPIDSKGPIQPDTFYPVQATPPNALDRTMIEEPFPTGVRAIDSMLTIGKGQRMGIFAGSGVGKSTLLGMIARNGGADVNVIALIGERGREVREFLENDLGPEGMARSVVVCATSDEPALVRIKAALTATAISEYFRDQGLNVMLMMDSVTRFAMAQREVGLAAGEPPSTRGYTPSVFALLPRLMERAGCSSKGAITAIYTVLVDGDDTNEPVADAARGILDGHIVLSRKLTSRGHYPPIDVLNSLSRVMPMVTEQQQVQQANHVRELMAAYSDVEDLINIGAYKTGQNPVADEALSKWPKIMGMLRQDRAESSEIGVTIEQLQELASG